VTRFVWTASAGWLSVLAFCAATAWPYLMSRGTGISLRSPHAWLGFAALGTALLHAFVPMPHMRGVDPLGLFLATLALAVMAWQIMIGLGLADTHGELRRRQRATHFRVMMAAAALAAGHVVLNRA
jgi:hypothetical protein